MTVRLSLVTLARQAYFKWKGRLEPLKVQLVPQYLYLICNNLEALPAPLRRLRTLVTSYILSQLSQATRPMQGKCSISRINQQSLISYISPWYWHDKVNVIATCHLSAIHMQQLLLSLPTVRTQDSRIEDPGCRPVFPPDGCDQGSRISAEGLVPSPAYPCPCIFTGFVFFEFNTAAVVECRYSSFAHLVISIAIQYQYLPHTIPITILTNNV